MKIITLNALAFYLGILTAFTQPAKKDTTGYRPKKLTLTEVNLVAGYYTQNGANSAVTGGIGTEALTDISNTIELQYTRFDKQGRKHLLTADAGLDYYTSASSDKIDPATISSASGHDFRFYPSVGYSITNAVTGLTLGATGSFSVESDYISKGLALNVAKASADNNREVSVKLQAYLDRWEIILPIELRRSGREIEGYSPRHTYSASVVYSAVINQRLQLAVLADAVVQRGLLGTPYQRVYFPNNFVASERLRGRRFKLPLGIKSAYFLTDRFILKTAYRYYRDDWGITAHTADVELPVKVSPYFSVSPFYRWYTQTAADDFAPYGEHSLTDVYFTSDYDLSRFNSHFYGAGFRLTPAGGLLGFKKVASVELRYGHYQRSNALTADVVSMHVKWK